VLAARQTNAEAINDLVITNSFFGSKDSLQV
jgi:hypothetical protein